MQKVKETVMKGEGYLHIKRLPKNTVKEIIDYFNDENEFGGDWALAMKTVWDTYKGMIVPKEELVAQQLAELHSRIEILENYVKGLSVKQPEVTQKKPRMADGKLRGNEEQ